MRKTKRPGAAPPGEEPIELVALSVKQTAARCRVLGSEKTVMLRTGSIWETVPGEIALVGPRRQWTYGGMEYVSGAIESVRIDPAGLDLVPLGLKKCGECDPAEH
jgi:hypothetical protein